MAVWNFHGMPYKLEETVQNWDAEDVLQRPGALEEGWSGTRLGQSDISPAGKRDEWHRSSYEEVNA